MTSKTIVTLGLSLIAFAPSCAGTNTSACRGMHGGEAPQSGLPGAEPSRGTSQPDRGKEREQKQKEQQPPGNPMRARQAAATRPAGFRA